MYLHRDGEPTLRQLSQWYPNAPSILDSLLKAELAEREVRSVNYQMKIARFPAYRDLSGFDFTQSVANETLVHHLHRGEFIDAAHNVVLIGGPGTGKTQANIPILYAELRTAWAGPPVLAPRLRYGET